MMTLMKAVSARTYVMRERADRIAHTREAILSSCAALAYEQPLAAVTLSLVAERAGVSVQTVLRQFGSREQLFDEAVTFAAAEVSDERPADPGHLDRSFEALCAHYEARGDGVILLLAQESWEPHARRATERGKALHRDWVRTLFEPQIAAAADPEALTDALVVVTDVYAWKLLRRDRGLDAPTTAHRMRALAEAVLAAATPDDEEGAHHGSDPVRRA
jgi:AcrR family transcriptional regulator